MAQENYLKKQKKILNFIIDIHNSNNLSKDKFLVKLYDLLKEIVGDYDNSLLFIYENDFLKVLKSEGYNQTKINKQFLKKEEIINCFKENKIYKQNECSSINKYCNQIQKYNELCFYSFKSNNIYYGGFLFEIKNKNNNFDKNIFKLIKIFEEIIKKYDKMQGYQIIKKEQLLRSIETLLNLLNYYDNYTNKHSIGVAILSKAIGVELNLSDEDIQNLYFIGILHDIGKIFIDKKIINKPSRLTPEEYNEIKKHPVKGAELLDSFPELRNIRKIILHHHERWDGLGYPSNLEKEEIPFFATIIAVADSYSAMTTKRPYKKPKSKEEALIEIQNNKGTQFNPIVVDAFMKIMLPNKINYLRCKTA